ncbi:MAG: general stress protein CsbA [Kiritimatiellia bacterium]|jgi:general stress protein CsbA
MHWPDAGSLTLFLFAVALTAISLVAGIVWATPSAKRPRALWFSGGAMALWMAAAAAFGLSGIGQANPTFAVFAPLVVLNLVLAVSFGLSPWGRRLAQLPIAALVGFHIFRLPLEIALHLWAEQGTIPTAMSWSGQNLDIITPILGLLILPFAKRVPWLVLLFEIVGVGLLINIFRLVAQNTPGSPVWVASDQPPLLLAAYFPTIWILTVCVFGAIAGHVVIGRWLWRELSSKAPSTVRTT